MLTIYNALTGNKEVFVPIIKGKVSMYACGITPYKPSHLGHAFQAIIFDVIRRYFEYKGFNVTYVRNYTDIDDKIINTAKELGIEPLQHAQNIINETDEALATLRVKKADVEPKVTENIQEIIEATELLIKKGFAYATTEGNVYYNVLKFNQYGKLSGQKLNELKNATRKDLEADKTDPRDFALWKAAKENEQAWYSPWGKGRPGWHIECSVMSNKHLGPEFDIHGGGRDLVFPHHENEIAQSEAMHDGKFANYWIHNGVLMVGSEKMSKSLKNDVSIKEWLTKYHPEVIRYLMLSNHYRSNVQFSEARYVEANKNVFEIYKILAELQKETRTLDMNVDKKLLAALTQEFEQYMDDDFNTVQVIAMFHNLVKRIRLELAKKNKDTKTLVTYYEFFRKAGGVLSLFDLEAEKVITEIKLLELTKHNVNQKELETLIEQLKSYRATKEFKKADELRGILEKMHVKVQINLHTTVWEPSFE